MNRGQTEKKSSDSKIHGFSAASLYNNRSWINGKENIGI